MTWSMESSHLFEREVSLSSLPWITRMASSTGMSCEEGRTIIRNHLPRWCTSRSLSLLIKFSLFFIVNTFLLVKKVQYRTLLSCKKYSRCLTLWVKGGNLSYGFSAVPKIWVHPPRWGIFCDIHCQKWSPLSSTLWGSPAFNRDHEIPLILLQLLSCDPHIMWLAIQTIDKDCDIWVFQFLIRSDKFIYTIWIQNPTIFMLLPFQYICEFWLKILGHLVCLTLLSCSMYMYKMHTITEQ